MTNELRNKIETELKRVYKHLGNWTSKYIDEKVEEMISDLVGERKQNIQICGKAVLVCPIPVAIERGEETSVERDGKPYYQHQSRVIELLVDESGTALAVKSYNCYEPDGWDGANIYEDEVYEIAELEKIKGDFKSI